jgi:hypothetical protein
MIEQTPTINSLMSAINDMHNKYGLLIEKNARNNRNTYADLVCVIETIKERCAEFGLMLIQPCDSDLLGNSKQTTMITHLPSGEWMRSSAILRESPVPLLPDNPTKEIYEMYLKAISLYIPNTDWSKSTTTYRRYCGMMSLGLFAADDITDKDDYVPALHDQKQSDIKNTVDSLFPGSSDCISEAQVRLLNGRIKYSKQPSPELYMKNTFGISRVEELPKSKCNEFLAWLGGAQ